ncbi:MAG: HNH endonuclease [Gammaproteobacteria bacterium]|nr:HNH endonuclease [Gammaproteobacteria bacterium]
MKITGRSSSITNAFINSIIPVVQPAENEVKEALSILEMTPETFQCSYCGAPASEWDHLRPLVLNKQPTGYISEINNLVPACGKCNQSKGNKEWRSWMLSDAKLSPKIKGIGDLNERINRLEASEIWGIPTKVDFQEIVGKEPWEKHWENWEQVQNAMRESQKLAEQINTKVVNAHKML